MTIEIGQRIKWVPPTAADRSNAGRVEADEPLEGTVINVTGDVLYVDFDKTPPGKLYIVDASVEVLDGAGAQAPQAKDPPLAALIEENPEMATAEEAQAIAEETATEGDTYDSCPHCGVDITGPDLEDHILQHHTPREEVVHAREEVESPGEESSPTPKRTPKPRSERKRGA